MLRHAPRDDLRCFCGSHCEPDLGAQYLNLRGFDPSGSPMTPEEAVRILLSALNVHPEAVPSTVDAQTGLYRSLLAGRRLLVVLDNAAHAEQVRPLLPGSACCLVVVTSRNQLAGLVAADGAWPLTLELLRVDEARDLLARHLGQPGWRPNSGPTPASAPWAPTASRSGARP